MSRCFECRGPKDDAAFICDKCSKDRKTVRTFRGAMDKIRGPSGQKGLGGSKVHLSQAERKSIEMQIGVPVEDAQDARRKMKQMGARLVEKGEYADEVDRAAIEWAECEGEKRGMEPPDILKKFQGWGPKRTFHFDHYNEFQRAVAEYKERGGVLTGD